MLCAVSDIHGQLDALKQLLNHVDLAGEDRLILLGDYIDYGPESGGVLRHILALQKQYGPEKVVALRGNHEEAFLEWLDTYAGPRADQPDEYGLLPWNDWLEWDHGFATLRTLLLPHQWAAFERMLPALSQETLNRKAARLLLEESGELMTWLKKLPYFYETENQIFVHAGIDEEAGDWWPWGTAESIFVGKCPPATGAFYKDIIAGHVGTHRLAGDPAYHGVWFDGQSHYYIDGSGQLNLLGWDKQNGYRQWKDGWHRVRTG